MMLSKGNEIARNFFEFGEKASLDMRLKDDTLFAKVVVDEDGLAKIARKPLPDKRYLIFFTPRSGSSRLGDLIDKTGYLRDPGEPFNPAFVPTMAQKFDAPDIETYVSNLMRLRNTNNVFGAEATFRQIQCVFGSMEEMLRLVQPTSCIWLIREDLVAQAVSLSRHKQTRVGHSPAVDLAAQARAEEVFVYKPDDIIKALRMLFWQEARIEECLVRYGLDALRLSYETTTRAREQDVVALICGHIGVEIPDLSVAHSPHTKLRGTKGRAFAERFRNEHPDLLARIDERRAERISKLHVIASGPS